jgi:hypothetical protein
MSTRERRIGPVGTTVRAAGGLGLVYLAGARDGLPWDVDPHDPIVGLVALPAVMVAIGLLAEHRAWAPIRLTGLLGLALNLGMIVALGTLDLTAGGAALFYGASMLLAAWFGQPGCEATVVSNVLLRRDDHIGCPLLLPLDETEARREARGY